jgi:hypothetical protein
MKKMPFALAGVVIAIFAGCTNVGDCPAATSIVPGGSCSGESLECPYTLQSLSPACDGTAVDGGIATSCVCTEGSWNCPAPVSCPGVQGDGGDAGAGPEDAGGEEATSDVSEAGATSDAVGESTASDALGDAENE